MARRKREDGDAISLFPFLSILAGVIGALTLMITGLALAQLSNEDEAKRDAQAAAKAQQRAHEYRQIRDQLADGQKQRDQLQRQLAEAQLTLKQLEEARKRLAELEKLQHQSADAATLAELLKRERELKKELDERNNAIEKLKAQLAARKEPPKEATVRIKPGGSGTNLDPYFVECAGGYAVLLHEKEPRRIRTQDLAASPEFEKLLETVKARPHAEVIFLVRDDGVWTYNVARNVARSRYVRNGKLPVIGHGHIDLSLFAGKTAQ